jgi:hypothetical protein
MASTKEYEWYEWYATLCRRKGLNPEKGSRKMEGVGIPACGRFLGTSNFSNALVGSSSPSREDTSCRLNLS